MDNHVDFVKANPTLIQQFSCKGLLFLYNHCPPDFVKAENWTDHNCLLHVITGNHILFNRERSWLISKGDTVFVKKGAIGIQRADHHYFCALMFYIPDSFIHSFMNAQVNLLSQANTTNLSKDLLLPVETTDVLVAFFNSVLSYFEAGQKPPEELIELKFKELLLNIISNPTNGELTSYLYNIYLSADNELKDIMERNFLYNFSLEQYARIAHRSLSKFKRDFDAAFGIPPGKWILQRRLEYAGQLLQNSKKSISDIVMESGFTNVANFDRVFKKCFGETPLQYRKRFSASPAFL